MVAMAVKGGAGSEPEKMPNFAAALQLFTIAGNLHSANLLHQGFAALKNLQDFYQGAISRDQKKAYDFALLGPYLHSLSL